ncbi:MULTISPECIES: DUF2767 family protein [Proteus]|uniref:DUF2767 family protein n=1 Tax=Proteus columbae TaxID=1987580 RepID=A0A6I7D5W6_9GAMM|nr:MULTISPECIES: DUF2767 family protein [Proteus]MBG2803947.1 DUF2767 family protein [Proteus mirabilis]ATN01135.1 hypothetical protein CRN77_15950 [Proteus vulgaris]MBG2838351.1 DUF2767 family protein [Proteus terrae subsp. cibarius]MBG2869035.1 DUF2767 family protein [Proteus terrae subsp. cibarius]MBI6217347.1 DUF2767 family protein [Proteus vulgaris]
MNIERDAIYESVCQVVGRSVMLLNEKGYRITHKNISAILEEQRVNEESKHMIAIYSIAIDLIDK